MSVKVMKLLTFTVTDTNGLAPQKLYFYSHMDIMLQLFQAFSQLDKKLTKKGIFVHGALNCKIGRAHV